MTSGEHTLESPQLPQNEARFARLAAIKRFGMHAAGRQMIKMHEIQKKDRDTRLKQSSDEDENLGEHNE
jgi:hypothetical protein